MAAAIVHWVRISGKRIIKDGQPVGVQPPLPQSPEEVYRSLGYSYPKFFKMDSLCKWAWLGAELLLQNNHQSVYKEIPCANIALVLATSSGSMDVDKRYKETMETIASPALFVYTLSNIMLGELCIRHGFKGEQMTFVNESFNSNEFVFTVNDLLINRNMDACLCGWADATKDTHDICFFWVMNNMSGIQLSQENLDKIYHLTG